MYVYAEQLLIENLIINYIILYATKVFTKTQTSKMRVFLASLIGSIYTLVVFFPSMAFMFKFVTKIIVAVFLIKVAFKPRSLMNFIKIMATFHLVAFTFAGACLAILYTTKIDSYITDGIFYISNFKIKKLIIAIVLGWILFQLVIEYLQQKSRKTQNFISLNINFKDKEVSLKGMVDTGNSLRDPLNKLPVIVVEFTSIEELFPVSIREIFKTHKENNLDLFTDVLCNSSNDFKFRLIPFKSLGKEDGMLLAFKPDKVTFMIEEDNKVKELVIGIYNRKLSNDDEYSALLHPDILI